MRYPKTWIEAKTNCNNNNHASLAAISDQANQVELDTFIEYIHNVGFSGTHVWIGGYLQDSVWYWTNNLDDSSGTPFDFSGFKNWVNTTQYVSSDQGGLDVFLQTPTVILYT